jgi:hypothetical protein
MRCPLRGVFGRGDRIETALASAVLFVLGCAAEPGSGAKSAPPPSVTGDGERAVPATTAERQSPTTPLVASRSDAAVLEARSTCPVFDWSKRSLEPILTPGKKPNPALSDRMDTDALAFEGACADAPVRPPSDSLPPYVRNGVKLSVKRADPAGTSGRKWVGNQCTFELELNDGSGRSVELGPDVVPPFNSITSLAVSGSAVWVELSFNGYTREFPKGGNRVVAVDLCEGRVVWKSRDGTSNGGIRLFGDYLVTAFGFTSERRFVYVLDARSGAQIQKLPVVENMCPSKVWAPNWDGGPCDAPGQRVGAASHPRIEGGLLVVDTNTGSSTFEVK